MSVRRRKENETFLKLKTQRCKVFMAANFLRGTEHPAFSMGRRLACQYVLFVEIHVSKTTTEICRWLISMKNVECVFRNSTSENKASINVKPGVFTTQYSVVFLPSKTNIQMLLDQLQLYRVPIIICQVVIYQEIACWSSKVVTQVYSDSVSERKATL